MMLHRSVTAAWAFLTMGGVSGAEHNNAPSIPRGLEKETYLDLGNKRLEGTHTLSSDDAAEMGLDANADYILVTEFFYGGVHLVDVTNQVVEQIVPSAEGFRERGGLGVYYTQKHILVASAGPLAGNPFEIYVYNAATGDLVTTCVPAENMEPGFMNDFEVMGDVAYVTDSTWNRLWNFNIPAAIAGTCTLKYQELDEAIFKGEGTETPVRSNGIVSFGDGFLIALFHTGGVYYVEPANGVTEEVIPLGDLTNADGLELVTEDDGTMTLYITEDANQLSVYQIAMGDGAPTATLLGTITSDQYDTPATSAVVGDMIYTANARVATAEVGENNENNTETYTETFGLVGVSRFVKAANETKAEEEPMDAPVESDTATPEDTSAAASLMLGVLVVAGTSTMLTYLFV